MKPTLLGVLVVTIGFFLKNMICGAGGYNIRLYIGRRTRLPATLIHFTEIFHVLYEIRSDRFVFGCSDQLCGLRSMTGRVAPVITIDGPTASGKGTIAQSVATLLGWHYLDSGALYRLVGLVALRTGLFARPPGVGEPQYQAWAGNIAELAKRLDVRFDGEQIFESGVSVGRDIRTEVVGNAASIVAALQPVRDALLQRQRVFRQEPGLIGDGRDMGTVVFPDAILKIFLTASAQSRAQRRYKQLIDKGFSANLEGLTADLEVRDLRDSSRQSAPLKPALGAVLIDSTALDVDETVGAVMFHYNRLVK